MPTVSAADFRRHLTTGTPQPVYLLVGDDERDIDDLCAACAELVEEELRPFNVERIYAAERARDAERAAVEAARLLPMMAPRRVVFLMRAERLLKPKGRRAASDNDVDAPDDSPEAAYAGALEAYLASPEPLTTLVLVAADVNKTLKVVKALYKQATVVECWGLKDGRDFRGWDLPGIVRRGEAWVRKTVAGSQRQIDGAAARLLAERAGADMSRLRGDIERLLLYVGDRRRISAEDAAAVVGAETLQDAFAVTTAVQSGDTAEALRQLALVLDAGEPAFKVLGQLGWFVREKLAKADQRRVPAAVAAVFRTDLDLKSSAGDPRVLLERLVVELCAGAAPEERSAPGAALRRR